MTRTQIKSSDLLIDRPLAWNVYDAKGRLIYAKGTAVDEEVKTRLLQRGVLRELDTEIIGKLPVLPAGGGTKAPEGSREVRIPLYDTSVRPGDIIHLERSFDTAKITARIIGYLRGKSIFITIPADEQGSVFPKVGEAVVARIFSGKHVLGFPCTVLAIINSPFQYVHLSYPADVNGIVVRWSERANVRIITAIDLDGNPMSGIITDISTGGVSLATRDRNLGTGTELVLNFKLPLDGTTFVMRLAACVRVVRSNNSDVLEGATVYGLQFCAPIAEDVLILSTFVNQQLISARSA